MICQKDQFWVADIQFMSSITLLNYLVSNSNLNKISLIKVPLRKVIKVIVSLREMKNLISHNNAERESNILNKKFYVTF